jgi:hypothetical protein
MYTMQIFKFVTMHLGLVYILTQSVIARPARVFLAELHPQLEVLVYCSACAGFWIGMLLGVLGYWSSAVEAAITGCCLGAVWVEYGPASVWFSERGAGDDKTKESENG